MPYWHFPLNCWFLRSGFKTKSWKVDYMDCIWPTSTEKKTLHMDITRWSTLKSDWLYFCSQRWRSSIQSAKAWQGVDCGSDHEPLIDKFWLKLRKGGKTTRRFRYDLNQIPYDYTVKVRNRFNGLDLIECLKNYGWEFVTLCKRQGSRPSHRKRNA